jgi:hypothetical protein
VKQSRFLFALLALCVLTSCATSGVEKKDAPPSRLQLFPAAAGYGFRVVSGPPSVVEEPSEILLAARPDADLIASMSDASTENSVAGSVDIRRRGELWSLVFAPPRDGPYWLFIIAKPHSRPGSEYEVLARLAFTARLSAPPHWRLAAGFTRLGMSIVSPGRSAVEDTAEIALSSSQEVSIMYTLTCTTVGGASVGDVEIGTEGNRYVIGVAFSQEGEYLLTLHGKPSADAGHDWLELARVRFNATVSAAMKVPPHWRVSPAFKKYGIVITSTPEARAGEWADVSFTSEEDISVSAGLYDAKTSEGVDQNDALVDLARSGKQWNATFFFPRTGEYDLCFSGKAASEAKYATIGKVRLSATVGANPAPAEGWTLSPRFRKYGFDIVSTSPANVDDEAIVVLALPEGYDARFSFSEREGARPVKTMSSTEEGPRMRIDAVFPRSGEYELIIEGGKKDEQLLREVARVVFVSTIDPSVPHYRLWPRRAGWPKMPLEGVSAPGGEWKPLDPSEVWTARKRGVLSEPLVVPVGEQSVTLRKGASVEFAADEASVVEALSFTLPRDLVVKAGDATVTLRAGSILALSSREMAGVFARDGAFPIDGNVLFCPKGSRLLMRDGTLVRVDLAGTGTLNVAGTIYQCSGSAVVVTAVGDNVDGRLKIVAAKATAFQFGGTKLIVPAGSSMVFRRGRLDCFVFARDFTVTVKGEKKTVPAGKAFRFDAKGGLELSEQE